MSSRRKPTRATPVALPLAVQPVPATTLATLAFVYLLLNLIAIAILRSPGLVFQGGQFSIDRIVFAALNVTTLSGFQQTVSLDQYQSFGQWTVLITMLGSATCILIAGGLAVVRIIRLPFPDRQVIVWSIGCVAVGTVGGAILLMVHGLTFFAAVLESASAIGNCGIALKPLPSIFSWTTFVVLLPLSLIGGLGVPVLMEIAAAFRRRRPMSEHAWTVLHWSAGLFVLAILVLTALGWNDLANGVNRGIFSAAAAINTRSAGFPVEYATGVGRTSMWFVLLLMMIGAAPAGTAGGIKLTTLAQIHRGTNDALDGKPVTRATGIALTWLGLYLLLCAMSLIFLTNSEQQMPADRILFLVISAASNVGLSHDPIAITGPGLYILSATMLLGRLMPLCVLWWMARTTSDADLAIG